MCFHRQLGDQRGIGRVSTVKDDTDMMFTFFDRQRIGNAVREDQTFCRFRLRMGEHGGYRAFLNDRAVVENGNLAADFFHHAHLMRDDDDRDAHLAVDILNQRKDRASGLRVQRTGRFITEQDLRIGCKRSGDGDPLLLTAGKLRRISLRLIRKSDQF